MRRFPWDIVLALLAGIGLGLVYAWMVSPQNVTNVDPGKLRADFKDQYRAAIAAAYAANGNLPRARARLDLLEDPNSFDTLNAQAQRMLARGDSALSADQVAALALAIEQEPENPVSAAKTATEVVNAVELSSTTALSAVSPDSTFVLTETLLTSLPIETQPAEATSTPQEPSRLVPTQEAPFKLTGQDELCDQNLPGGLLQVLVLSSNRRQMPGMEIDIAWEDDADHFFTGLKPELGNGYADFIMLPDIAYTVQLAVGSEIATGLTAPTCQTSAGDSFYGGIKLTFQQP